MRGSRAVLAAGLAIALAVAAVAVAVRGTGAALGSLVGALVALAAQAAAVALLRPAMGARTPEFVGRWASGMAVRGLSLVVVAVLMVALKGRLPVIWFAAGYLAVLLPLLFLETRFLK